MSMRSAIMEITMRDRFLMKFKLFQLWRFFILNIKILRGVEHSKRLPPFVIKYKVSYVASHGGHPPTMVNIGKPPQVGERVQLGRDTFEVVEVLQPMPPKGEFCFLQARCKYIGKPSES
jgi:hypothetical protein